MKKFVSVFLCAVLCLALFSACGGKQTVLTIGQAEIDEEIFAYFFSRVYTQTEADGGDLLDTAAIIDAAVDACGEYVSSVTLFEQMNLTLSADDKMSVANSTEDEWLLYGSYYTAAGISKQAVAKIKRVEAMRTALLLYYFGEGSEYEVSEEEIEYYFDQTYVQFQAINGYLTSTDEQGNSTPLSETEIEALKEDFESKKKKLEAGLTLAEVNGGTEIDPTFVAVSNSAYPEGFLAEVAKLETDTPAVIEAQDYIFLVVRMDAKEGEESYYNSYRTSYIEALRGEMLTDLLIATTEDYEVNRDESALEKTAKAVIKTRNERK